MKQINGKINKIIISLVLLSILIPNVISGDNDADINSDGEIDLFDLELLKLKWGYIGDPGSVPQDITKDGRVDILDYIILINQLLTSSEPPPFIAFFPVTKKVEPKKSFTLDVITSNLTGVVYIQYNIDFNHYYISPVKVEKGDCLNNPNSTLHRSRDPNRDFMKVIIQNNRGINISSHDIITSIEFSANEIEQRTFLNISEVKIFNENGDQILVDSFGGLVEIKTETPLYKDPLFLTLLSITITSIVGILIAWISLKRKK